MGYASRLEGENLPVLATPTKVNTMKRLGNNPISYSSQAFYSWRDVEAACYGVFSVERVVEYGVTWLVLVGFGEVVVARTAANAMQVLANGVN